MVSTALVCFRFLRTGPAIVADARRHTHPLEQTDEAPDEQAERQDDEADDHQQRDQIPEDRRE